MNPTLRRFLTVALVTVLLAAACSSGDDESGGSEPVAQATTDAATTPIPPAAETSPDPDEPGGEPEPISPVEPTDPATVLVEFARNVFNIDPDEPSIQCLVSDAAEYDGFTDGLNLAIPMDDLQLERLTYVFNGCLKPIDLGAWATQAVGPTGPIRDSAPACFGERFASSETGDATFYTFTALTLQYRVDPAAVPDVTEALATCTPVSSLQDFFAGQREFEAGFEVEVDRDCLRVALDTPGISEQFWTALIDGDGPPVDTIAEYITECSATVDSDLLAEVPADFVPWSGEGALAAVRPQARANVYTAPPPMTIDPDGSYEAVIATAGGEIRLELFADTAPLTVNNFVNLARDGYFDRTVFHRVLADFMAQAGDPLGSGTGGPGYQFADEVDAGPPLDRKGLVAMANAGPDTNGSQFFITVAPTEWLTGLHTVFGEVISGQEIVDAIELRDPNSPSGRGQVIDSITIIED